VGLLNWFDWVEIPAGWFKMGDNFNEGDEDERPVHDVYLDGYYVCRYEVTFEQYDRFCDETGRTKPNDEGWGRGNRPVITVSWYDAQAFCVWVSEKTGEDIHLPTEAQWEKAARGTDQRRYPWGNGDPDCNKANYLGCNDKTMPVGSYPAGVSPYGVHDMAGNVYEWCLDWYDTNYYSFSPTHNPQGPASGSLRVSRGGSCYSNADLIRSVNRNYDSPSYSSLDIGFRLCREK
ncbi:MAG: formylglycine-generating enzyme family protein, partial [Candidatus Aminicenantes bacterium]|nr:formylglycine-generating enzyme family protein [Candidatus Aminicenantes bacterium]